MTYADSQLTLPYIDEDGLFADFHGNRHTFIRNLGRAAVPLVMAQRLARHSDPKLTTNTYTHLEVNDQAAAIESLPAPPGTRPTEQENGALRATGTDDIIPAEQPTKPAPARDAEIRFHTLAMNQAFQGTAWHKLPHK